LAFNLPYNKLPVICFEVACPDVADFAWIAWTLFCEFLGKSGIFFWTEWIAKTMELSIFKIFISPILLYYIEAVVLWFCCRCSGRWWSYWLYASSDSLRTPNLFRFPQDTFRNQFISGGTPSSRSSFRIYRIERQHQCSRLNPKTWPSMWLFENVSASECRLLMQMALGCFLLAHWPVWKLWTCIQIKTCFAIKYNCNVSNMYIFVYIIWNYMYIDDMYIYNMI
jgi:hypothetical protein